MTPHLTVEQKRAIRSPRGRGLSLRQVAREVGCTAPGAVTVLERTPVVPARPDLWRPGPEPLAAGRARGDQPRSFGLAYR